MKKWEELVEIDLTDLFVISMSNTFISTLEYTVLLTKQTLVTVYVKQCYIIKKIQKCNLILLLFRIQYSDI